MYEIFSKLLQEYGVTTYKVSKATRIPQSTLSDWKRGISSPKYDKLQKLADFFAVSTDYLLGKTEDEIYDVKYEDEYHGINHIGEYLKETRESRGYSIKELSEETGISEKVLNACEDGTSEVKSNVFKKILEVYDITRLDFEDEHNILSYEARPEFRGDYNASYAFDQALEHDQTVTSNEYAGLSKHENAVIKAYRSQPEMQPAVDRILGITSEPDYLMPIAAHNDQADDPEELERMKRDLDEL